MDLMFRQFMVSSLHCGVAHIKDNKPEQTQGARNEGRNKELFLVNGIVFIIFPFVPL